LHEFRGNLTQFLSHLSSHLIICVQTQCIICVNFALKFGCWKIHFSIDISMWYLNKFSRCLMSFLQVWHLLKQFAKLLIFQIWDYCLTPSTIFAILVMEFKKCHKNIPFNV
jgi:hypothetical protein